MQINLELTIEEIVLIKECLFFFTSRQTEVAERYKGQLPSFDVSIQKQLKSLEVLSDKLAPYGYGM